MSAPLHVLGPQRPDPNAPDVIRTLPGDGPLVMISAGWRYEETDAPKALARYGIEPLHLPLYAWYDELRVRHPGVDGPWRARQAQILSFKELYQTRMRHLLDAVVALQARAGDERVVRREVDDALADVRRLDARVLEVTAQIQAAFPEAQRPWEHPAVRARAAEAEALLRGARAILVAGGHVGVLRNRLQFFGLHRVLWDAWEEGTAVVAWSAGAMALSERIVLFYDDPPEGPTYPELFDRGLGLLPGAVFLPHARRRLRLDEPGRVALLASRFGPEPCIGLELGAWLERVDGRWVSRGKPRTALWLAGDGQVIPWEDRHV